MRVVELYIAPRSFVIDKTPYRFVVELEGKNLLVDDVRAMDDLPGLTYIIYNTEHINEFATTALLKRVEEGNSNFIFQTASLLLCNKALTSRCVRHYIQSSAVFSESDITGNLNPSEMKLFKAMLGQTSFIPADLTKDDVRYSEIFRALSTAFVNRKFYESVPALVWQNLSMLFSLPYLHGNRYMYLYIWRKLNA